LTDPKLLASRPDGTGAYTLGAVDKGTSYTLNARTGYTWGPDGVSTSDRGFPSKLVFSVVTNDSTAANLLLSGDLDIVSVQGPDLKRLESRKDLFSVVGEDLGATLLIFNQKKPAFRDPSVRKALSLALNRQDYNRAATEGSGEVIDSPAPHAAGCPEAGAQALPGQDAEEAQRLLTSSGWAADRAGKLAKDGTALTTRIIGWNTMRSGPEYLSETLQKLGVSTVLSVVDLNTLVNIVIAGKEDWDIVLLPSSPTMQSPNAISVYFTGAAPPAGTNVGSVSNATYESARTTALSSTGDARCEAWVTSTRALTASFDVFPMIHEDVPWFGRDVSFKAYTSLVINPLSIRANG
jgi:peptide/nickel transport system substrate-binding protein